MLCVRSSRCRMRPRRSQPVGDDARRFRRLRQAVEGPVLVVRKGPQPGERFYLDRPSFTVGRDPDSDIFLNDMTVSRAHAVLDRLRAAESASRTPARSTAPTSTEYA